MSDVTITKTAATWRQWLPVVIGRIAAVCVVVVVTAVLPVSAQSTPEKPSEGTPADLRSEKFPTRVPGGRTLRPIGLYQSQVDQLIPDDYRPVAIDRLGEALRLLSDRASGDQASRLRGAVYWVEVDDDMLVSDHSIIDIESERDGEVRRSLGRVNLAIERPPHRGAAAAGDSFPRMESDSDGNLIAVFRGDAKVRSGIEFKWRLRGRVSGSGHEFTMQLPPTPQTRIVLSAPSDITVEAYDGVLRSRPGPPPDASELVRDRDLRWYELDAGGLSRVRIRTQKVQSPGSTGSFVIRRSSVQYEADSAGLIWTSRMVVHLPPDLRLPSIAIRKTTVTGVSVNGIDVPFTSNASDGTTRMVQLDVAPEVAAATDRVNGENRVNGANAEATAGKGLVDPRSTPKTPAEPAATVNITLMGYTQWTADNVWCELPMPVWTGDDVVQASVVDDVKFVVREPLQLMAWELPGDWKQAPPESGEGMTRFTASGPPLTAANSQAVAETGSGSAIDRRWSRVRLTRRPLLKSSQTHLRLEIAAGSLQARARVAVQIDPDRIEPLQLQVERGWSLDSVIFPKSGRVVESPKVENSRTLLLWPEREDASESEIMVEATGTRLLPGASGGLVVPATWFLRPLGARGDLVAAIAPPPDLNWSSEAVMHRGRVERSELPEAETDFFSGLDQESLWFTPEAGRTPAVSLQRPSVSFNARTILRLDRDGSELVENLEIEVESQAQGLKQLSIQTGATSSRPSLSWSISGSSDSPTTSLPASDVTEEEADGVYLIDVTDKNLRGRRLIARRRYPLQGPLKLQLPSVPGAGSQSSEVVVGPGLLVKQTSNAVQRVPFRHGDSQPDIRSYDSDLGDPRQRAFTRLRYDAVEQPSITVSKSDVDPNLSIVWSQRVRVIASSRGTDRVEALLDVSPTTPLRIQYDPAMQLASISRNGKEVDLVAVQQRPAIVLQPRDRRETIRIHWNRSQLGSAWVRRCAMPHISVSGIVLQTAYELVASPDAFAPAALLRASEGTTDVEMRPGQGAVLVRRNIALAVGWLFALLIFSLSWYVTHHVPLATAAMLAVTTALLFLWWPWRLAVIGWLIVPIIAAALLATSRAWTQRGISTDDARHTESSPRPRSVNEDQSSDFSLGGIARLMLMLMAFLLAAALAAAQDDSVPQVPSRSDPTQSINVLVPVTEEGALSGKMVYIPRSLYAELFPPANRSVPQDARIESAEYLVKIDPSTTINGRAVRATVEAEYWIRVDDSDHSVNRVRLPLAFSALRRVELIDDVTRIVKSEADSRGAAILTLPKGSAFQLRVTLLPRVSESGTWTKVELPIPVVAASRLTVESEQSLDAVRVGGKLGYLLPETDLRRWITELGPIDSLEIDFRTLEAANSAISRPLERRYWIHAGERQVTIDCEVEPPREISAGETFQFVIRDAAIPHVISLAWRLDRSELYNPTRRLITVTSTRQSPGPIRLLWTRPIDLNEDQPASIRVPEVIAAALGENAPAWLALHCDSSLQFQPISLETNEPISVDDFLRAWSGYRGRIDRAYVLLDEIPAPVVVPKVIREPAVSQRHHVHVMPDRLEVHYTATLTPSEAIGEPHTLRLPRGLDLIELTVDNREIDDRLVPSGAFNEVVLGSVGDTEAVTIRAVAVQRLPANRQFSPPHLQLLPSRPTSDVYSISRDRSTTLRTIKPASTQTTQAEPTATADSLARGWIPVVTWASEAANDFAERKHDALYQVKTHATRFDSQQLIILARDQGQWSMETLVKFNSARIPDFVDIDLPTRWCESLEVGPTPAWSRQPARDPSRQIIRVLCDRKQLSGNTLSIRGQLDPTDSARVSVPSVRILGFGGRRIHVSVPNRLSSEEQVQWRTSAVEAVSLPDQWVGSVSGGARSTYLVANPSWSIELAPLPDMDADAIAVSFDAQVFAQHDGALVMCHWDLFPGGLGYVDVRLPPAAACLGAWTAGRAVIFESLQQDEPPSGGPQKPVVRLPLSLSRLSQPVDLLMRVPASRTTKGQYLAELQDVPVTQRWLSHYVPSASAVGSQVAQLRQHDRALALAHAVVDAVEAVGTVDRLPRDEVATWMELWLARYRTIAASDDHIVDLRSRDEDDLLPPERAERLNPDGLTWSDLDARIAFYASRFITDGAGRSAWDADTNRTKKASQDPIATSKLANMSGRGFDFGVADFSGFVPQRVSRLSASNRPLAVQPVSSHDQGLRNLILNVLTLLLVGGLLVCLRPLRGFAVPLVTHPAFWLALMGIFGFAVAPVAVAAAIILVAFCLAAFPSKRPAPE